MSAFHNGRRTRRALRRRRWVARFTQLIVQNGSAGSEGCRRLGHFHTPWIATIGRIAVDVGTRGQHERFKPSVAILRVAVLLVRDVDELAIFARAPGTVRLALL